jgi:tetratricopeptide (TPR) repeat protein
MGTFLQTTRRPREAIDSYLKAMRLSPYYPAWYVWKLGSAYFAVREYENALIPLKEALNRNPKFKRARLALAATYAQLDRIEEAGRQVEELLADHPDASIRQELQLDTSDEEREHWLEGLRRAGLPE